MADLQDADVATRLARIEDRLAIVDLLAAIARGIDRYDRALLAASIWPDADIDMGLDTTMTGAAFAAALKPPAAPRPGRMHVLGNPRVEIEGDRACSEAHIISCMDVMIDGLRQTRVRAGRYLDRFERREGRWGLAARTMVDEWGR